MKKFPFIQMSVLVLAALLFNACTKSQKASSSSEPLKPDAIEHSTKTVATNDSIRFLEERVRQDPEDFIAYNKLASEYLQQMRETGDATYLNLASRAANTSLEILPPQQNKDGLATLALVKYSMHEFAAARDYAKQLIDLEPNKGYPYQMLGDALLELGQYEEAEAAFKQMERFGGIQVITQSAIEQRLARLAALKGDLKNAAKHYSNALKLARSTPVPSPETVAYCEWQSGETAFAAGDYKTAEKYYKNSLATVPDYPNAMASMGRVLAARNDLTGAIDFYERASRRLPDLVFVAALGDLYKIAGREQDAQRQYELVEQIGRLGEASGTLYNRGLALFYADHDLKVEEAYRLAAKEYEARRDIYGADALAWTALKAGKTLEAQAAAKEALRLGTKDARLFYHAGMIAQAAGDKDKARRYLQSAISLNPKFEPLQAEICRKTLESL
jgi:tetratricopeptide (TPR) repeat protein